MSGPGPSSLASLDGEIMPVAEATISVADHGLVRGDGAFEVMRVYDGRPFALDAHLARLQRYGRDAAPADRPRGRSGRDAIGCSPPPATALTMLWSG